MTLLKWWLRVVGALYLFELVAMAILRLPIRANGPAGVLERAAAGDPTARFVVDIWITFGLEVGAIGAALLIASRVPERAKALVWGVLGIELMRGVVNDVLMIARGHQDLSADPSGGLTVLVVWIFIHSAVIATGLLALTKAR